MSIYNTTKIVEGDTLPLGEQKVVQAGVKGSKEITRTWTISAS